MNYSLLSKYRTELMGLSILGIVLHHAWDLNLGRVGNWIRALGFFGVDVFILVSALGLVGSLSRREQSYGEFMLRRARRVLPAYYVVMVPYTIYRIALGAAPLASLFWNSTLLYYWVRSEGGFNWYISGVFAVYLVIPPLFKLYRRCRHKEWLAAAGAVLAVAGCRAMMSAGRFIYMDVIYRIPSLFLGLLMGFYVLEERELKWKDYLVWTVVLLMGAVFQYYYLNPPPNLYIPQVRLFTFTTVPMCLVLCAAFRYLPLGGLRRFLKWVGESSLEIYLFNVSFFAEKALLHSIFDFGLGTYVYYLLVFPCNILLGVGLHRLLGLARSRYQAKRLAKAAK